MASYKTISSPFKFSGSLNNFERDVIEKKKMSDKKSYGAYPDLFTVICSDIDASTGQPGPDHGKLFVIDKTRALDPVYGYCVPAGGDLPSNVTKTFTEMPDPESYTTGTIVQYVGADTPEFESGNFYKVTETASGDHEWHHVSQGADVPENITEALKTMPVPTEDDLGRIVQYIGADSPDYASGNFYTVVEKPGEVPPYVWEHVSQITDTPENLTEALKTMPVPTEDDLGRYVQYIGEDTTEYTGGNFYKVVEKPGEVPPYVWEHVSQGTTSTEVFKEMPDPSKYDEGTVVQYVGPDTDDYSTGNFYKVVNVDGQLVWQHISQGADDPETKNYTEAVKEMPDPEKYAGKFVQYIGEDTAEYAGGNFYKAVEDSESANFPKLYPMTGSFSYIFNGDYKTLEVIMKGESRKVGDPIYSLTFDDDRQAHLKQIGKIKELSPLSLEGLGGDPDTEEKIISDLIDSFDGVHKSTSVSSEAREYEKSTNPSLRPQPLFSLYFTPDHTSYDKIWWQYTYEGIQKQAEIVIPVDPNYQHGYDVNDPYIYWAQLEHDGYNATVVGKHAVAKIVEEIDIPADAVGFESLAHCYKLEKYAGKTEPGSELETVRNMISNAIDQQNDGLFFIFEMINTRELGSTGNAASYWLDFDKYFPSSETSLLYMLGDPVYFYCGDSYEAYMLSYPLHPEWPDQMDVTVVMFKNSDYDHPAIWSYNGKIATDGDGLESFKYRLTEAATDPGSPSKFYMEYECSYVNEVRDAFFEAAGFTHESGPGPYHYTKANVPQSVTPWTMYRKGEQPYKDNPYKWEHVEQGEGGGGGHDSDLFNGTGKVNINNFANIDEYTDFSFVDFMKIATSKSPTFDHIFINGTDTRYHGDIVEVPIRFTMTAAGSSPIDTSTVKVNSASVSETYPGSGVYEYTEYGVSDTTDFVLTGKCKDGSSFAHTCTLKFVYPWYYGTLSKNTSLTESDVLNAIYYGKINVKAEDYTNTSRKTTPAAITSDGEYVAFVTACDSPKIKDQNGFVNTMDFTQAATVYLHTATYYVYVSKNICVCTNFEYTVE